MKASIRDGPRHLALGLQGSVITCSHLASVGSCAGGTKRSERNIFLCFMRKDKGNSYSIVDLEVHQL